MAARTPAEFEAVDLSAVRQLAGRLRASASGDLCGGYETGPDIPLENRFYIVIIIVIIIRVSVCGKYPRPGEAVSEFSASYPRTLCRKPPPPVDEQDTEEPNLLREWFQDPLRVEDICEDQGEVYYKVTQQSFLNNLSSTASPTVSQEKDSQPFRRICGCLQWLASQTRRRNLFGALRRPSQSCRLEAAV